jgi:DNA-binding HxlR family transcriptional regulator
MSSSSRSAPALELLDLVQSHRVTAVIYVAAKLGIAELLSSGPRSLSELVTATGANHSALARLLTTLATIGICARVGPERYSLTEIGRSLDGRTERSLKGWVIFEGELLSKSWNGMLETIMTGKTAAELQGFANSFELMARVPENVRIFNAAMADLTGLVTVDVLAAYDFSRFTHLMDVGGGSGELIGAVATRFAHIRATVFDLPRCEEAAIAHLARLGVSDRADFRAGDFFEAIPAAADGIILKSVIHDWNDARSCTILRNCRRAIAAAGTLLLVERLIPAMPEIDAEHKSHALSDLNMLRGPGGMERTEAQYRDLLDGTGFRVSAIAPAGRFNVIEAKPV